MGDDEERPSVVDRAGGDANGTDEKSGTFLVTAADEGSAVLSAVADGQVCPLGANPGFEVGEVVEGRLEAEGPLGVTWRPVEVAARWTPEVEAVDESPGRRAVEAAEELAPGQLAQLPAESGALHVLAVPAERTEAAVEEVVADETTRRIAARLGARRVEVRAAAGVVGVRYQR